MGARMNLIVLVLLAPSAQAICNSTRTQAIEWFPDDGFCYLECRRTSITGGYCAYPGRREDIVSGALSVRLARPGGYPPVMAGWYLSSAGRIVTIQSMAAEDNNSWGGCLITVDGDEYGCRVRVK